jgi:hypothetical protein
LNVRRLITVAAMASAVGVGAVGCGGGEAQSPSNRYQADPNDTTASTPAAGTGSTGGNSGAVASSGSCADKTGEAFSKCASEIYGGKRYAELISTCKTAIKAPSHSESEKTAAANVCLGLMPPAFFLSGHPDDARDVLALVCKGQPEEQRTNVAARATFITVLGMGKDDESGEKLKGAVITFAGACGVEPGAVAQRVIELSKQ